MDQLILDLLRRNAALETENKTLMDAKNKAEGEALAYRQRGDVLLERVRELEAGKPHPSLAEIKDVVTQAVAPLLASTNIQAGTRQQPSEGFEAAIRENNAKYHMAPKAARGENAKKTAKTTYRPQLVADDHRAAQRFFNFPSDHQSNVPKDTMAPPFSHRPLVNFPARPLGEQVNLGEQLRFAASGNTDFPPERLISEKEPRRFEPVLSYRSMARSISTLLDPSDEATHPRFNDLDTLHQRSGAKRHHGVYEDTNRKRIRTELASASNVAPRSEPLYVGRVGQREVVRSVSQLDDLSKVLVADSTEAQRRSSVNFNHEEPTKCLRIQMKVKIRSNWANKRGKCESCEKDKKQCIYFIDDNHVVVVGQVAGAATYVVSSGEDESE